MEVWITLVTLEHCAMGFFYSSHSQFDPSRPPLVRSTHANTPHFGSFFQSRTLFNDRASGFSRDVWYSPTPTNSIQNLITVSALHGILCHGIGYGTRRLKLACMFLTYEKCILHLIVFKAAAWRTMKARKCYLFGISSMDAMFTVSRINGSSISIIFV